MTEPTGNPTGRPSEYPSDAVGQVQYYLDHFESVGEVVPTVEGLAGLFRVSKQTIYTWAEAHADFLDALNRMKTRQGLLLQNKGLKGEFAPVITKLMLSANHGMAEKSVVTNRTVDEEIRDQEA